MSDHHARLRWQRDPAEPFVDQRYSRRHSWHFDGGAVVPGSSSPSVVRPPFSDPSAVDPEEALVASVSSCHLLWFLSLAAEAVQRLHHAAHEACFIANSLRSDIVCEPQP